MPALESAEARAKTLALANQEEVRHSSRCLQSPRASLSGLGLQGKLLRAAHYSQSGREKHSALIARFMMSSVRNNLVACLQSTHRSNVAGRKTPIRIFLHSKTPSCLLEKSSDVCHYGLQILMQYLLPKHSINKFRVKPDTSCRILRLGCANLYLSCSHCQGKL